VVEVKAKVLRMKLEQSDCLTVRGGSPATVPVTARAQFYSENISSLASVFVDRWFR
jgi:hypothetical protein